MPLSMTEVLQEIRRRPAIYIGSHSLKHLAMFLRGFHHACYKTGVNENLLMDFQAWIQKRFKVRVSRSWEDIIEFHCGGGNEAMDYFWRLFDEFIDECGERKEKRKRKASV